MREPKTFRRKPEAIEAMQWTGDNAAELIAWTGGDFQLIYPEDRPNCDDPESTGSLFGGIYRIWFEMATWDWVCRLNGHFCWIDSARFAHDYEAEAGE